MASLRQPGPATAMSRYRQRGQALLEFAIAAMVLMILAFILVDFSRAIFDQQVITNLTREGSNLAAHGATLPNAANAVSASADVPNFGTNGRIILTTVQNKGTVAAPNCVITAQYAQGGLSAPSRIGTGVNSAAALPSCSGAVPIPQPGQLLYATEVYYQFTSVTPVGNIINVVMPSRLYDVAVF